ncbi:50S ribosomal protein L6 [Patescibacteria group bacterium]|nr:50S ribosomal protein L6 [Patescibacteria group bacterium]MBU1705869.1 50S ribosomal protein L6 [Patescibacteria group bacterium]
MSRIGRKPIVIPAGVEITIQKQLITAKGPKGELKYQVNPLVAVAQVTAEDNAQILELTIKNSDDKNERAQWGTARANLANVITGVSEGFTRKLELNGVGYRVNVAGRTIVLNVGYSHEVKYELPASMEAVVEGNVITLTGVDKQVLGEVASGLRKIRKPEPYKGKGIKYIEEVIRRKAGKAAKASE